MVTKTYELGSRILNIPLPRRITAYFTRIYVTVRTSQLASRPMGYDWVTGAKIPSNFHFLNIEVYRMGVGSEMCLTASLQEAAHAASEGSWLDGYKAVVLVLPQWWEDVLREVNWSWKGGGSPWIVHKLGGCNHQLECARLSES